MGNAARLALASISLIIISVVVFAGLVGSSFADIPVDKDEKIKSYGDFRLGQKADFDSMKSGGTGRKDRNRTRIRFRSGEKYKPIDEFLWGEEIYLDGGSYWI